MIASHRHRSLLICTLLGAITLVAYWPVLNNGFINLDDYAYVSKNPHVQGGLTWENIKWAFQSIFAGYWLPITWMSHMLDVQLFGLNEAGITWLICCSIRLTPSCFLGCCKA